MKQKPVLIEDPAEIKLYQAQFKEAKAVFFEKVYHSHFSEASRNVTATIAHTIKAEQNKLFLALASLLIKDVNARIDVKQLKPDLFLRSNKNNHHQIMHLEAYEVPSQISIEWYTDYHWVRKSFTLVSKKANKTKIIYRVLLKNKKAKTGPLDSYGAGRFLKAEILNFRLKILMLKKDVLVLNEVQKTKLDVMIFNLQTKIKKINRFNAQARHLKT